MGYRWAESFACLGSNDLRKPFVSLTLIPDDSWPAISRLFDEALDLPEHQREAWLARLATAQPALAPAVQALLWAHESRETDDFLERGPQIAAGLPDENEPALQPGDSIGPYRLLRPLGQGGMAVVWLAERSDGALAREVALKLPQQFTWRPGLAERFQRERDILARLEHPHIARLYDAGLSAAGGPGGGRPYLALEYVQGSSLTAYCDEHCLGVSERVALAEQVMAAVQYAHTRLVIHRDLKPANILVTQDGQVRLLDFGVAKLLQAEDGTERTELTRLAGRAFTPDYASPEQVRGETLSTASDVYSLGVVLYELLSGQRPYQLRYDSAVQLEQAILEAEPAPPSSRVEADAAQARGTSTDKLRRALRGELDTIVLKTLKKRPEVRYATVAELAEDLRRWRNGEPVMARPDTWGYRARKYVIRHKLIVGSGLAVALALGNGLGVAAWQYQQALEQARAAREEASTSAAVQGFMEGIFRANSTDNPDPEKARRTTAQELLNLALNRLDGAMPAAPVARVRMLILLSEIYVELGLFDVAIDLGQRAVTAASEPGLPRRALFDSLGNYAIALSFGLKLDEQEKALQQQAALAKELRIEDPRALAQIEVGYSGLLLLRSPTQALPHIDKAIGMLRRSPSDRLLVEALFYKANAANLLRQPEVARASALEAQQIVSRDKGTEEGRGMRPREASLYKELSRSATLMDDFAAAIDYARLAVDSALALHERGDHFARRQSAALVDALMGAARPGEAIDFVNRTWHLPDSSPDAQSYEQLLLLGAFAQAQTEFGHEEEALATLQLTTKLLEHTRTQPTTRSRLEVRMSVALMRLGHLDEAEKYMQAAALHWGGTLPPGALLLSQAELALAWGRPEQARQLVITWQSLKQPTVSLKERLIAEQLLAEADLQSARWDAALQSSERSLAAIGGASQRPALADLEARVLWTRGRALLGDQKPAAALPSLQQALALMEPVVDRHASLQLAKVLGSLAKAQIGAGQAQQAQESARRMKAIFARHPDPGSVLLTELAHINLLVWHTPPREDGRNSLVLSRP